MGDALIPCGLLLGFQSLILWAAWCNYTRRP
jgi:hypothetical protein